MTMSDKKLLTKRMIYTRVCIKCLLRDPGMKTDGGRGGIMTSQYKKKSDAAQLEFLL
jgi:hypothetical protein